MIEADRFARKLAARVLSFNKQRNLLVRNGGQELLQTARTVVHASHKLLLTWSAVERSTLMDIPRARLWYLPLMWSRYDAESLKMQSHTLQ